MTSRMKGMKSRSRRNSACPEQFKALQRLPGRFIRRARFAFSISLSRSFSRPSGGSIFSFQFKMTSINRRRLSLGTSPIQRVSALWNTAASLLFGSKSIRYKTRAGEPFMLNECDGLPSYTRSEKPTCRKPASPWNSGVSMIRTANGLSTLTSADEPCGQGSRRLTWVEMIGVVTPLLGETAMLVSFT